MANPALKLVTERPAPYSPQGNFTRTPNVFYDILPELGNAEARVLLAVVRETFGHNREAAELSFTDLERGTGLSRPSVASAIDSLLSKTAGSEPFFIREEVGQGFAYSLDETALVNQLNQLSKLTRSSKVALPEVVKLLDQSYNKEVKRKETKERKAARGDRKEPEPEAFPVGTWQRQYAERCADRLAEFDLLPANVKRGRTKAMQDWAGEFDKLHRIDGHNPEAIAAVMRWLLDEGNWWIRQRTFRSASKLRQRVKGEETTYFELFAQQMQRPAEDEKPINLTEPVTHAEMARAARKHGFSTEPGVDFFEVAAGWDGKARWQLKIERQIDLGLVNADGGVTA